MIAQALIRYDRATGVLEGADAWERFAAMMMVAWTKVSSPFSYRGYNGCANLIKTATNIGYNVFATSSAFWVNHISTLNASAARATHRKT